MFRRCCPVVLLIVVALALPARAQVTLEWKLKKGDQFFVRSVSTFKQSLKTQNREMKQDVEITAILGFNVEDRAGENLVLKETVLGLTTKSAGEAALLTDEKIKGAVFTLTLSPKMEVLKLEGHDKLIDKLAGDDLAVRKTLQAILGEETLKKSVRDILAILPDRPVKDGETWERVSETPFGPLGILKQTITYKLEGKEDVGGKKVSKISFTTALDFKAGKADPSLPFNVASGELKTEEAKGTLHFDDAAGRLVQAESKMTLRGRMILAVSGINIDSELQQEQTSRITILKDNPVK